ncbi:MAG: DUF402 domain-containing protein [Clostridiales bacterium]|jgi:predicted RNA-binding protein associated with RNAse of E/G family|nr:DUF402 domain-containing protein [Clostridiales bacterium]
MKIYRRRYLPEELLWLKDDEIVLANREIIVTRWRALKPRPDFSHGISCYFLHRNYKISKFFGHDDTLLYYYCDIVKPETCAGGEEYIFNDLLVDVKVFPDGSHIILDLDELADVYQAGLISGADVACALKTLDGLLKAIYAGEFGEVVKILEDYE